MMEVGIIRPSKSNCASPLHLVPKSCATWRACDDYRALNSAIILFVVFWWFFIIYIPLALFFFKRFLVVQSALSNMSDKGAMKMCQMSLAFMNILKSLLIKHGALSFNTNTGNSCVAKKNRIIFAVVAGVVDVFILQSILSKYLQQTKNCQENLCGFFFKADLDIPCSEWGVFWVCFDQTCRSHKLSKFLHP